MPSSRTNILFAVLLAVLACGEVVLITSDASNGIRYGVGAALALAMLAVVARLAKGADSR
ncbi:hypothetical protein ACFP51_00215 [Streptomyces pratens]|uniref:Uncharacterized protein n=1 Tax=Streptomyces pratens TaxID=887456 RepID=A0ABW1LST0_9ACTN